MSARIVLLTGNHFCHNPRVIKEATTLGAAGYEVAVFGAWFDPVLKQRDNKLLSMRPIEFVPVLDRTQSAVRQFGSRLRTKVGSAVHRVGRVENRWQLGQAYSELRRAAFEHRADLYIGHSEAAMAVILDLSRSGRRVALDMEDWFSEDLMPNARKGRPLRLLRSLEAELLTNSAYVSCPSLSISQALADEYRCRRPVVVYNAFPMSERKLLDSVAKDRRDRAAPSIHWFSQTLGPGRGLEELIAALPLVHHTAEIHLRGVPIAGFEAWILQRVPANWRNRVFIHGLVPNDELLSRISEHDIGFAGEQNYCRSRNLTISNKILYYLLAGLAVVASDTAGQCEVAEQAGDAVLLYPVGDASALATRLNALLARPDFLLRTKAAALRAAETVFCWERQREVLLTTVAHALYDPDMAYHIP